MVTTMKINNLKMQNQSNESQNNSQEQENDVSQTVKVHEGSSERTADKDEFSDLKVNRDNVFDYVIAAINQNKEYAICINPLYQPIIFIFSQNAFLYIFALSLV